MLISQNVNDIRVLEEATLGSMDFPSRWNNNNNPSKGSEEKPSFNDQHFLLNFIMSTYFGPDVYSDNPRCSASHRIAKRFPPYTSKNLGSSFLSTSQLQSLYYYVLRNANSGLVLEPNMLHMYLKGKLPLPSSALLEDCRQFPSFFPLNIHEHKRYSARHEIVKGVVLIDNPVTSYIKEEDLKRFRCLSGRNDLKLDKIKSLSYQPGREDGKGEDENNWVTSHDEIAARCVSYVNGSLSAKFTGIFKIDTEGTVNRCDPNGNNDSSMKFLETYKRRRCDPLSMPAFPCTASASKPQNDICKTDGPAIFSLLAVSHMHECVSDPSIIFTGTAREGISGPPVGVLDIGISKAAYFFRVALPGVRKNFCEFSCEIEPDGRVLLQGSITGGKTVKKRSRTFEMKFRQLCPPGPFTLCFNLPGPVDPRLFSPNFRSDGIFEAVIIKL